MIDIGEQLEAISRGVEKREGEAGEVVAVHMRRHYAAGIADVWSALTDPDRLERWFYPLRATSTSEEHSSSKETPVATLSNANRPGSSR